MGIVKKDSITITILSYVGVAVGYVNKILLFPNLLSEEQVGLTAILVSLAVMYAQFSALGVNSTLIRFFPFFRTADRKHGGMFFWSALTVSVGFLLFTALFLLFREPVTDYFAQESPLLSKYYLLLIPLGLATLFYNFFNSWLQALSRTVVSTAVYEVGLRLLITAEISMYALGMLDFEQFVVGYILIHFVPTLILLLYTVRLGEASIRPMLTRRTRKLITIAGVYGLWQYLGGTSLYITSVIDQTMLAGMQGLAQGGVFAIMMYVVSVMVVPYRSMLKVAAPVVTHLWKERDMSGMQRIYRSVSSMGLIVGSLFFVVIWVNLDNLFSLLPEAYASGRYVFLFLALGRVFDMYTGINGTILVTSKYFRYDFLFSLLLVGITVATNALLIPTLGMNGAALATLSTVLIYNTMRVIMVWRFFHLHPFAWRDAVVIALAVATIGVSACIPPLGHFLIDGSIRTIVVTLFFGGSVYLLKLSPALETLLRESLQKIGLRLPPRT